MPNGLADVDEAIALIAYVLHTQPSEFDAMTVGDLETWLERANLMLEKTKPRR